MEIGLPKENGRVQILNIHTTTMKSNKKLSEDVDIAELAGLTKNFSGAEIEGLVRAAQSCALNRLVKADGSVTVDEDAADNLKVRVGRDPGERNKISPHLTDHLLPRSLELTSSTPWRTTSSRPWAALRTCWSPS